MRKKNLILLSIVMALFIVMTLSSFPMVLAAQNSITNISGNTTAILFAITTTQTTVNPRINTNVSYFTNFNVTTGPDGLNDCMNITGFVFHLPDNSSTTVSTDFVLSNYTGAVTNSSGGFNAANYSFVNFSDLPILQCMVNGSEFNLTWRLDEPIAATKLATVLSGRAYTETWNITSSASNLTIVNATLNVTPTYWYTRIGNPVITFNSTTKTFLAAVDDVLVYTDLNVSSGLGNLLEGGSGSETLSITYNGPAIDQSSGSSATTPPLAVTPTQISITIGFWVSIIIFGVFLVAGIVFLVISLNKGKA